jgi:hypothetical protein
VLGVADWVEISAMAPTQCHRDKENLTWVLVLFNQSMHNLNPIHKHCGTDTYPAAL